MPQGGQQRDGATRSPERAGAATLLRTDPVVLAAVCVGLAAVALRLAADTDGQLFYLEIGTDLLLVLLTIAALFTDLARLPTRDERRFWSVIACGFGAWALVLALYLSVPDAWWTAGLDLLVDSLFLVFYLSLLVAVDGRPDLRLERRVFSIGDRYRLPGAAVFSVGLFLYFVLVPAVLSPGLYESLSPSLVLFLALDLYLAVRLLILSQVARTARWRRCFALTAAIAFCFLVADAVELLEVLGIGARSAGLPWDALWLLPSVAVVAAVRLRALPVAVEGKDAEAGWSAVGTLAPGAPFLAYAFFLPLVHFAAYRTMLFDEPTRPVHEGLVLIWLLCLGAASLVQYLDLERRHHSLVDQRRLTEEKLWHLANFDQLTGLPNRILFRDRLQHALKQARRGGQLMAVVFADLDDFKQVNDTYGHATGDQLLRAVAQRMAGSVRDSDTVARLGGDEFTVILEAIDDSAHVEWLAHRISRALSKPFEVDKHTVRLGSSLGIGIYPTDGEDVDALLERADAAMYESKRNKNPGRSRVRVYSPARHAL